MFTGIVQGRAWVVAVDDSAGLRSMTLGFPSGFGSDLAVGASVAVDGVCLTVTEVAPDGATARFDAMQQTLSLTTLGRLRPGSEVNAERAARDGAEIGGHPLSGHVDCTATVVELRTPDNNRVLRLSLPAPWMRYVFAKGYIAVAGASLTVAEAERQADGSGWFEVWLIPETLRATTFGALAVGDRVNVEIDRSTQVVVDTVRDAVAERLGALAPLIEAVLRQHGASLDMAVPPRIDVDRPR